MAEGKEEKLENNSVKGFSKNASPPGGNTPPLISSLPNSSPDLTGRHTVEKESGIEESQPAEGDKMVVGSLSGKQEEHDSGGPTLFLPVCHVWNIVSTRHENVRFQQRAKRAGTPGKTLVLETEVYPKYSILGHKNWLWLCLKLTIESPDRCDYHFKAQVEVKLYDRQKAKLLCTRTACHNIQEEGDGKFFVELIPYTEIESQDCQELEIYINVTVTSRRVSFLLTDYMLPETKEEERAYVNIDVSKPSD